MSHVNCFDERVTEIHAGAHFPLCLWTVNTGARSTEAAIRRAEKNVQRRLNKDWGYVHPPQMTPTIQPLDTDFNKPLREEWEAWTAVAEGKEGKPFRVVVAADKGLWVGQDGVGAWHDWHGDSEWVRGGSSSSTGQTNGDPHAGWARWMDYPSE